MKNLKRLFTTFFILTILLSLSSCVSYYQMSLKYQTELEEGDYNKAFDFVKQNKFLKKKRNKSLRLMEMGKMAYLNNLPKESNTYFNSVDSILEENKKGIGNKIIGNFTNPENEIYSPEDFEKVAIHYYKAINYVKLGEYDAALVEVRRVNLRLQQINDKYKPKKKNRYKTDAFALTLQGLIYEASGDINNAFIAYRNAVDLYLSNELNIYFGTSMPNQLVKDLLRTADFLGFYNEVSRYKKYLKTPYNSRKKPQTRELVIIWEKGLVPFKNQDFMVFSNSGGVNNGFATFNNSKTGLSYKIPVSNTKNSSSRFSMINVAFASYVPRKPVVSKATVTVNNVKAKFEKTEDYDAIAIKTLEDRRAREIGKTVLRLGTKKIAEELVAKENKDLGTALSIVNALTEKADTRNWQSLPSSIHYSRVPLKKGENIVKVTFKNKFGKVITKEVKINGKKGLTFYTINSF